MENGELDEALARYNQAIDKWEGNYLAYNHRGVIKAEFGNLAGAEHDLLRALAINPKAMEPFTNLAIVYERINREGSAMAMFKKAIEVEPQNGMPKVAFGEFLMRKRDFEQALAVFNEAEKQKFPDNKTRASVYSCRAVCLDALKRAPARQLADLNRAINLYPEYTIAYCNRAHFREKIGDITGAHNDWLEATRLEPENELVQQHSYSFLVRLGTAGQNLHDMVGRVRMSNPSTRGPEK